MTRDLTLVIVDAVAKRHIPWMAPQDIGELLQELPDAHYQHQNGFPVAFVDGSIRFLRLDVPASPLRAMISIDGNNDDAAREYD